MVLPGRLTRFPDAFEAILVRLEDKISLSVAGPGLYVRGHCAQQGIVGGETPDVGADLAR